MPVIAPDPQPAVKNTVAVTTSADRRRRHSPWRCARGRPRAPALVDYFLFPLGRLTVSVTVVFG
jgi:hypothetical protein